MQLNKHSIYGGQKGLTKNLTIQFLKAKSKKKLKQQQVGYGDSQATTSNSGYKVSLYVLPPLYIDKFEKAKYLIDINKDIIKEVDEIGEKRMSISMNNIDKFKEKRAEEIIQQAQMNIQECQEIIQQIKQCECKNEDEIIKDEIIKQNINNYISSILLEQNQAIRQLQKKLIDYFIGQKHQNNIKNQQNQDKSLNFINDMQQKNQQNQYILNNQQNSYNNQINIQEQDQMQLQIENRHSVQNYINGLQIERIDDYVIAQDRDERINRLQTLIGALNLQFKQLHLQVIEQGTLLDRIDFNLESATKSIKKGTKKLQQVNKPGIISQRAEKCTNCLILSIFIMLGVLIVKLIVLA